MCYQSWRALFFDRYVVNTLPKGADLWVHTLVVGILKWLADVSRILDNCSDDLECEIWRSDTDYSSTWMPTHSEHRRFTSWDLITLPPTILFFIVSNEDTITRSTDSKLLAIEWPTTSGDSSIVCDQSEIFLPYLSGIVETIDDDLVYRIEILHFCRSYQPRSYNQTTSRLLIQSSLDPWVSMPGSRMWFSCNQHQLHRYQLS